MKKSQQRLSYIIPQFPGLENVEESVDEDKLENQVGTIMDPEIIVRPEKKRISEDEPSELSEHPRRETLFSMDSFGKKGASIGSVGEAFHSAKELDHDEEDQIAWLRGHSRNKTLVLDIMGSDEDPKEYDRTRELFKKGLIVTEITGVLSCFFIIFWTFYYAEGKPGFGEGSKPINLHVIIMIFFMFYIHGHAAIIYRVFPHKPKFSVKLCHFALHLVVCIAVAVGLAAAVHHHNVISKQPHFYSFHSWLGLVAIIVYYGQFLGGFIAFLLPTTPVTIRALVLPIHRICGQSAFTFCAGAIVTGVMLKALGTLKDYPDLPISGMVINFGGFFALLFSIGIGFLVGDHRFRRRPRPEGELLLADATDAE